MLEDHARRNGFPNPTHFTDDGISETHFDRASFNAMMEEVEAGHVEATIITDMSRLLFFKNRITFSLDILFH